MGLMERDKLKGCVLAYGIVLFILAWLCILTWGAIEVIQWIGRQ